MKTRMFTIALSVASLLTMALAGAAPIMHF